MAKQQKAPDGFAWVPFGGTGDDVGTVEIKGTTKIDGERVSLPTITVPDVVIPFPVTEEAMTEYASGRTFDVEDEDGNVHTLEGIYAMAAQKVKHDYETVRGQYRTEAAKILKRGGDPVKAIDVDAVRGEFRTIYKPGRSVQTKAMDRSKLEGLDPDEILAELEARGLLK